MKVSNVFSLAVLAVQVAVPWSVPHMVTQDGPAHLYTAYVAKDLIFHRKTSPYRAVYRVQKTALPNWTGTALLAGFLSVAPPQRGEAFLITVCLLTAYCGFVYCQRALPGEPSPLLANWLIQTVFLWAGFYNFYLGMALFLFATGYYLRHERAWTWPRAALLAGLLVLVFFTHLIPATLALLVLTITGSWLQRGSRQIGMLVAAIAPCAGLTAWYALRSVSGIPFDPSIKTAVRYFPYKLFLFTGGWIGGQKLVWPLMLCMIAGAVLLMRRAEWRSLTGPVAGATLATLLLYLLIPDAGLGGSVVKMRFAWAFFLLGALLLGSVERMARIRPALTMLVGGLLLAQLWIIAGQVRNTSAIAGEYLAALDRIPERARFVRLYYPAPLAEERFRLNRLVYLPLLHLDALAAVRRHAVDLSDYQSATGTFGVDFKKEVGSGQRLSLWGLETPDAAVADTLVWLRGNLPVSIEYAVVFGEPPLQEFSATARPVEPYPPHAFVRVYRF